jgi:hypothetical protein
MLKVTMVSVAKGVEFVVCVEYVDIVFVRVANVCSPPYSCVSNTMDTWADNCTGRADRRESLAGRKGVVIHAWPERG